MQDSLQNKLDFYTKLLRKLECIGAGEMTLSDYTAEVKKKIQLLTIQTQHQPEPTIYFADSGRQGRLAEYQDISSALMALGRGLGKTDINCTWDLVKEIVEIRNYPRPLKNVYSELKALGTKQKKPKEKEESHRYWEGHITSAELLDLYRKSLNPKQYKSLILNEW